MNNVKTIQDLLTDRNADAFLLTHLPSIRWTCGFTGSNAALLVDVHGAAFVTDGRYDAQAREEVQGAEVHVYEGSMWTYVEEQSLLSGLDRIVVQSDHMTVDRFSTLTDRFADFTWVPETQVLTRQMASKNPSEIDRIRRAQRTTEAVLDWVVGRIEPGRTERDIAADVVHAHLTRGADSMSFDPIVASGPHAALPHARPTDREIQEGDLIVLDMGGFVNGYASDMTRTLAVGEPGKRARAVYAAVRRAQSAALEQARAGLTGAELDAVARDVLEEDGLADAFTHSLGHGLGLEIHEWPRVSRTSDEEPMPAGACITIEPGVYLPEEEIGVRIEDVVVLEEGGSRNLTDASHDLTVLDPARSAS